MVLTCTTLAAHQSTQMIECTAMQLRHRHGMDPFGKMWRKTLRSLFLRWSTSSTALRQKYLVKINKWSTKQSTCSSKTNSLLMGFGRTELKTRVSEAKNCEESAGDVRFGVGLPKLNNNCEKRSFFPSFCGLGFFGVFVERQASYRAETLTTCRSRSPGCFVYAKMFENCEKNEKNFAKLAKNFANIFARTFGAPL